MSDDLQRLLETDPLIEAEKITGREYKEDRGTSDLGMMLAGVHGEAKERALRAVDDTTFEMSWAGTMRIFFDLGFSTVHSHRFPGHGVTETFVVLWRPDGVLAKAETYNGVRRNTADVYYNWRPTTEEGQDHYLRLTSSGGYHHESYDRGDKIWIGSHDVREAMRHKLGRLEEHGEFLPIWVKRPFLWLLDYSQSKVPGYDHRAITESVVATLPEHVRNAIAPEV